MGKSGENGSESKAPSAAAGTNAEPVAKKPPVNLIKCDICSCEMSSDQVMTSHVNGSRHRKRLKALEIVAKMKATGEKGIELGPMDNPNTYRCEICSLSMNSPQQLEIHLAGSKHKSKIAKDKFVNVTNTLDSSKPEGQSKVSDAADGPPAKKRKKDDKSLTCSVCNVLLNSESQYEQHILSKRHLNKLKGENQSQKGGRKGEAKNGATQNVPPDNRQQAWNELDRSLAHKEPFRQRNTYSQANNKLIPVTVSHGNRFGASYHHMSSEDYNNGPYSNYFHRSFSHH